MTAVPLLQLFLFASSYSHSNPPVFIALSVCLSLQCWSLVGDVLVLGLFKHQKLFIVFDLDATTVATKQLERKHPTKKVFISWISSIEYKQLYILNLFCYFFLRLKMINSTYDYL